MAEGIALAGVVISIAPARKAYALARNSDAITKTARRAECYREEGGACP
jgi:hypothetical protein